jgi:hypothetical protein
LAFTFLRIAFKVDDKVSLAKRYRACNSRESLAVSTRDPKAEGSRERRKNSLAGLFRAISADGFFSGLSERTAVTAVALRGVYEGIYERPVGNYSGC